MTSRQRQWVMVWIGGAMVCVSFAMLHIWLGLGTTGVILLVMGFAGLDTLDKRS